MATVKCPLKKRGKPSHEWHDGVKSRIYCMGWIDSMTDELLDTCKNCPDHVNKAQDDLEKWYRDQTPHPVKCAECAVNPVHPEKKCCFNCIRDLNRCQKVHTCGRDCPDWLAKLTGEEEWEVVEIYTSENM